jgi:hypothetical protein
MGLNIVAKFMEKVRNNPNHPTELNMVCFRLCAREPLVPKLMDHVKSANLTQLATETDDELASVGDHWFKQLDEFKKPNLFRNGLLKMVFSYSRLLVLSFGLQHAKEDYLDENSFLMRVSNFFATSSCLIPSSVLRGRLMLSMLL